MKRGRRIRIIYQSTCSVVIRTQLFSTGSQSFKITLSYSLKPSFYIKKLCFFAACLVQQSHFMVILRHFLVKKVVRPKMTFRTNSGLNSAKFDIVSQLMAKFHCQFWSNPNSWSEYNIFVLNYELFWIECEIHLSLTSKTLLTLFYKTIYLKTYEYPSKPGFWWIIKVTLHI